MRDLALLSGYWQVEIDNEEQDKNGILHTWWAVRISSDAIRIVQRSSYFSAG
jgi:hypothetical protein